MDDGDDGEMLAGIRDRCFSLELIDDEVFATGYRGAIRLVHAWFDVAEIDGFQRLFDVEVTGLSVEAEAVPVEDPISGIRVLLDFVDEKPGSDGVKTAGGNEDGLIFLWLDGVDFIGDRPVMEGSFEVFLIHAFLESDVEFGSGITISDIPHFSFGFPAEFSRQLNGWMDLNGKVIAGVEDFDEEWKSFAGETGAKEFLAVIGPEIVKGFSSEGAMVDDGLFLFPVAHFPGLAVGLPVGKLAMINAFKRTSPPDARHVERGKSNGFHCAKKLANQSGRGKRKSLEGVALFFDDDVGRYLFILEPTVAGFEVFPEIEPFITGGPGEALFGHFEGEDVNAEEFFSICESGIAEGVDFLDEGVGHGEAADGDIRTVDHDEAAGSVVGFVKFIGIADVEGKVEAALGIELALGDEVKPFGNLAVAFAKLGAEAAGGSGNGVGFKEEVFFVG